MERLKYQREVREWTPEELARVITEILTEAKSAGVSTEIENDCCGCSKMKLVACSGTYGESDYIEKEIKL